MQFEPISSSFQMNKHRRYRQTMLCSATWRGKDGDRFARLLSGHIADYPSQSEADLRM